MWAGAGTRRGECVAVTCTPPGPGLERLQILTWLGLNHLESPQQSGNLKDQGALCRGSRENVTWQITALNRFH